MATEGHGELSYAGIVELRFGSQVRQLVTARNAAKAPFRIRNARWTQPLVATVEHGPARAAGRRHLRHLVMLQRSDHLPRGLAEREVGAGCQIYMV